MFKKMMARREAEAVQMMETVGRQVAGELDDTVVAIGRGIHAAYERRSTTHRIDARLTQMAVNAVSNAVQGSRHVGGDEGTVGYALPRTADGVWIVLGARTVSFWSYEMYEPTRITRLMVVPRDQVRLSEAGTPGFSKVNGAQATVRFSFADGSFADYNVVRHETFDAFWGAVTAPAAS